MKNVLALIGVGTLCYGAYQAFVQCIADPIADELAKLAGQHASSKLK